MNQQAWRAIEFLALALEPAERSVVLGDLEESAPTPLSGFRDLLGLIVRRQVAMWRHWRPWLAVLGVSILAGAPLSRMLFELNGGIMIQLGTYFKYGVRYDTGVSTLQDVVHTLCLMLAVIAWSWACGFVLGALSGRAVWIPLYIFYAVVIHSAWSTFVLSGHIILRNPRPLGVISMLLLPLPLNPVSLVWLLITIWGAILGIRRRFLSLRGALAVFLAILGLAVLNAWTGSWYQAAFQQWSGVTGSGPSWPRRMLPSLLASWPAAWLLLTARGRRNRMEPAQ